MAHKWTDAKAAVTAAGLCRGTAIVHNGLQIGPGGYATDGVTQQAAAELPANTATLFSTDLGVFALARTLSGTTTTHIQVHLSPDGLQAYTQLFTDTTTYVHASLPQLIHCGGDRIVVADYGGGLPGNKLWYSADAGENWTTLFTTAENSIRHFHGGIYDPVTSRLYLFTGDTPGQITILWTDDVDDLAANPNTWKGLWGLDNASRSNLNTAWIVGTSTEPYRIVNAALHGDWMYFGGDYNYDGGPTVTRVHRTTHAIEKVWIHEHSSVFYDGQAAVECWAWGLANDGTLLLGTAGRPVGGAFNGDGYAHFYALQSSGRNMRELFKAPITTANGGPPTNIHTIAGYTIIPDTSEFEVPAGIVSRKSVYPVAMDPRLLIPSPQRVIATRFNFPLKQDWCFILLETGTFDRLSGERLLSVILQSGDFVLNEDASTLLTLEF